MESPFLSAEEEVAAIKALQGVLDCTIDEATGFQLITVQQGTDYHSLAGALKEAQIEPRNFFIQEGEEFVRYNCDTLSFTKVGLETVTAARWHTQHTKTLASEPGKRSNFEDLLKPTGIPPSPHQIVAALEGMSDVTRKAWLAKKPEYQHLWDNRADYLDPIV